MTYAHVPDRADAPAWALRISQCPACGAAARPPCPACAAGGPALDGGWDWLGPYSEDGALGRVYDGLFERSETGWVARAARLALIDGPILDGARGDVLDLGCGDGRLGVPLQQRGLRVLGVDVSAVGVERARRRGLWAIRASALALPFADGSFDSVVAGFGTMAHLPAELALRESARVLRPGGTMGFHDFGAAALAVSRYRRGAWARSEFHRFPVASGRSLQRSLCRAGLRWSVLVLGVRGLGGYRRMIRVLPSDSTLRRAAAWSALPTCWDIVVVAHRD